MTTHAAGRSAVRKDGEARHRSRQAAVQMLYQSEVGRVSMAEVLRTFWTEGPAGADALADDERAFAVTLATGVSETVEALDPMIAEAAEHWRLERMNVLDRIVLRLAVYEFLHQPETPAKVVINEALELARIFSTDESVRFVNGVLDAIRRGLGRE